MTKQGWREIELSKSYRFFYPVVSIVVSSQYGGKIGGMAAISYMPISFNPPLVALSIAPEHGTYSLVGKSKHFALNWIDISDASKVEYLGETSGGITDNKIAAAGFHTTEGKTPGLTVISDAAAVIECAVRREFPTGDHHLFIGQCLEAYATEDFMDYWSFEKYTPTIYIGSKNSFGRKFITLKKLGQRR